MSEQDIEQLGEAYTLKLKKVTHPKDVTDDMKAEVAKLYNAVKAIKGALEALP